MYHQCSWNSCGSTRSRCSWPGSKDISWIWSPFLWNSLRYLHFGASHLLLASSHLRDGEHLARLNWKLQLSYMEKQGHSAFLTFYGHHLAASALLNGGAWRSCQRRHYKECLVSLDKSLGESGFRIFGKPDQPTDQLHTRCPKITSPFSGR